MSQMQHQISLAEAIELTTRYRKNPLPELPLCETFDQSSVSALLAQNGCHSFRIYLGRKADDSVCSVLVAADAEGKDILPSLQLAVSTDGDEGIILEDAFRCPPACPPESPLNG
jgi:hypothetical protein